VRSSQSFSRHFAGPFGGLWSWDMKIADLQRAPGGPGSVVGNKIFLFVECDFVVRRFYEQNFVNGRVLSVSAPLRS